MNNLKKKIVAIVIGLTLAVMMAPGVAQALTAEELQTQINTLMAQLATLQTQLATLQGTAAPAVTGCTITSFDRNLKQGMTGADVKCLQIVLNSDATTQVAATGVGSSGNETTYFGALTKAAVVKFQEKYASEVLASYGLTAGTGFVGSTTRAKLNSTLSAGGVLPTGCSCTAWANDKCKGGTCTATQMNQTRTCTPAACAVTTQCVADATCVVAAPLTVALTSDTPVGTLLLAGSANNTVTKVTFSAAADTATTITALTIKSYGTARLGALDIARIKVFDGTTQVGLTQIQVNGISTFTFAPGISIPAGGSKTLSIAVDIAATGVAIPSSTVKMGIEAATSVLGATFTGTFPIVGNAFTIVAGGSIGVVNVTPGSPVPVTTVAIGTKNVVLGNLIVTSGTNEDINITQFNVNYGGAGTVSTSLDTDVTNVRVKIDGVLTGTSTGFTTRRATVDFTTPVSITKGTSKVFQVIGDIAGAGRAIELSCEAGSIFGVGAVSGAGVSGPANQFPLGLINRIAFGPGTFAVSVSTVSPAGSSANVIRSITPQVLGVYDVRAVGEDILVSAVGMAFNGPAAAAGTIANVGLYNEAGALLSDQVQLAAVDWDNTPTLQAFGLNWLIPANTTQKLYVKGVTSGITGPVAAVVNCTLADTPAGGVVTSIWGTGMSSSGQAGPNNITSASLLALPALTINAAATFLAVADPTLSMYNQAVLGPTAQTTLGYLKVTAQRENQDYRALDLLAVVTGGGTLATTVSGVALFDGANPVTNFVAPGANIACPLSGPDDVCFTTTDIITPTTFTNGVAKTLKIVTNVLVPAVEAATVRWTIPVADGAAATIDGLQTLGRDSGQVAENAALIDIRTNVGAANATGTYTQRTNVLEVKKAGISPSGDVRGTFQNHGIWDLDARGSVATLDVSAITFTSTVGLPATAGMLAAMFRLYDYTNSTPIPATATLAQANGRITFSGIPAGNLRVTAGSTLQIALQVTTTDTVVWPLRTSLQWGVINQADVTVGAMGLPLVVATDPDFGTGIGVPTFNGGAIAAGSIVKDTTISVVGAASVYGTDRLYLKAGAAATVAANDIRLAVTPADVAAGRTVGSIVGGADADFGNAVGIPTLVIGTVGATGMTGVAANAFVLGTNALYIKGNVVPAGTVQANDVRVVAGGTLATGLDWQGDVGYGGVTVSIPAVANTVTLTP